MSIKKVIILFSGEGNNMLHIIKKIHKQHNIEVVAALTNKKEAKGIKKLEPYNIPIHIINNTDYDSREEFDQELVNKISYYRPDLVVLAGFMRILTPIFTQNVKSINLHPSMLPFCKGAKAIEQSFSNVDIPAGVSVHWVSDELDGGAVISQQEIKRIKNEEFDSFKNRIHLLEYELLPSTIIELLK